MRHQRIERVILLRSEFAVEDGIKACVLCSVVCNSERDSGQGEIPYECTLQSSRKLKNLLRFYECFYKEAYALGNVSFVPVLRYEVFRVRETCQSLETVLQSCIDGTLRNTQTRREEDGKFFCQEIFFRHSRESVSPYNICIFIGKGERVKEEDVEDRGETR